MAPMSEVSSNESPDFLPSGYSEQVVTPKSGISRQSFLPSTFIAGTVIPGTPSIRTIGRCSGVSRSTRV